MNSPETIASVLVSFSAIGFIVLFGTATVVPMIYELTVLRKNESVVLLRRYPYRLISRLGETLSIVVLMITSLLFVVVGLLSLIYFLTNNGSFLDYAVYFSIIIVLILLFFIACIVISAIPYKEHEINQIIDYSVIEANTKSFPKG